MIVPGPTRRFVNTPNFASQHFLSSADFTRTAVTLESLWKWYLLLCLIATQMLNADFHQQVNRFSKDVQNILVTHRRIYGAVVAYGVVNKIPINFSLIHAAARNAHSKYLGAGRKKRKKK